MQGEGARWAEARWGVGGGEVRAALGPRPGGESGTAGVPRRTQPGGPRVGAGEVGWGRTLGGRTREIGGGFGVRWGGGLGAPGREGWGRSGRDGKEREGNR